LRFEPNSREIAQPRRLVSAQRRSEQPTKPRPTKTKHCPPLELRTAPYHIDFRLFLRRKARENLGLNNVKLIVEGLRKLPKNCDQRDHQPRKLTFEDAALGYGVEGICDHTSSGRASKQSPTRSTLSFFSIHLTHLGFACDISEMPHIETAMHRSMRRSVGDIMAASLRPRQASAVAGEADKIKSSFSSWSNCMNAAYCKSVSRDPFLPCFC